MNRLERDAIDAIPEPVSPEQFFSTARVDASLVPEKRLMLAVLEDAVWTLRRHAASGRRTSAVAEAEAWIASNDASWPFSFVGICHALGFEESALRARLVCWRRETAAASERGALVRFPLRRTAGSRHAVRGRAVGQRRCA